MADFKDILSDNEEQTGDDDFVHFQEDDVVKNEDLLDSKTAEALFENDALEGLKQINSSRRVKSHVNQLNQKLQQQLSYQKKRTSKNETKEFGWIILTLLILLFICIVGYFFIRIQKPAATINATSATIEQKAGFFLN